MHRWFGFVLTLVTVVLAVSIVANEKPTAEYQRIMKSNGNTTAALGTRIMAKDYDAIAKDAATVRSNLAQTEMSWMQKESR